MCYVCFCDSSLFVVCRLACVVVRCFFWCVSWSVLPCLLCVVLCSFLDVRWLMFVVVWDCG